MYKFANTAIDGLRDIIPRLESNLEELETLLYSAEHAEIRNEDEVFELEENILFIKSQKQDIEMTLRSMIQFNKESGC